MMYKHALFISYVIHLLMSNSLCDVNNIPKMVMITIICGRVRVFLTMYGGAALYLKLL